MKRTLLNILGGLLAAAMLLGAVCIGAVRGWQGEREAALMALSEDDGLRDLLEERAMDAANLTVVAARILPEDDERLARLRDVRAVLTSGMTEAPDLIAADRELTELAQSLAMLPALSSVQISPRDLAYISTLTRALTEPTSVGERYADLARGFNNRLISSPTGWIARMFGVSVIEVE